MSTLFYVGVLLVVFALRWLLSVRNGTRVLGATEAVMNAGMAVMVLGMVA